MSNLKGQKPPVVIPLHTARPRSAQRTRPRRCDESAGELHQRASRAERAERHRRSELRRALEALERERTQHARDLRRLIEQRDRARRSADNRGAAAILLCVTTLIALASALRTHHDPSTSPAKAPVVAHEALR